MTVAAMESIGTSDSSSESSSDSEPAPASEPEAYPALYGDHAAAELASHYESILGLDKADVLAEWQNFRDRLAKRPQNETFQSTYSHFKNLWSSTGTDGGPMEILMDIKAVIIFASVCCERGFSHMKLAKGLLQSEMNSVTLDIRLRVQLLAPRDPRVH